MENNASLFLTDYASYNNGTQFEFGHWVDLTKFSNADEFGEYITKHLKECDRISPLDEFGSIREEPMFTDYENMPSEFYNESYNDKDIARLFVWIGLEPAQRHALEILLSNGQEFSEALDNLEEISLNEYGGTYSEKWQLFEMMYPEASEIELSNPYISIDIEKFIKTEFTEFTVNDGTTYLVADYQLSN